MFVVYVCLCHGHVKMENKLLTILRVMCIWRTDHSIVMSPFTCSLEVLPPSPTRWYICNFNNKSTTASGPALEHMLWKRSPSLRGMILLSQCGRVLRDLNNSPFETAASADF